MSQRAFYSIDDSILEDFNRLVPAPKRSKMVETLLAQHVAKNANAIEKAARLIESDPSYNAVRGDADEFAIATLNRAHDE